MSNMMKRLLALTACVLLLVAMVTGCGKEDDSQPSTLLTNCTVTVQSEGGVKLANVGVSIYTDKDKTELVDFARTDDNGVAKMNVAIPSDSCIFLTDVPDGYEADGYYSIDSKDKNPVITLYASLKNEMTSIKLGDVMFDMTVTDQNGTEHTLSKLLKSKKAVAINLWYTTCGPCKMEFPFLQQAYNEYKDDIALLAITPMDSAAAIASFATENGLTIPMAACDAKWNDWMVSNNYGYPTTIIVDRFGTVAFIHSGSIDNSKTFKNMFAFFTDDDYAQTTVSDINQFVNVENDNALGTAANPFEYSGTTGFSVEVEPAQTVYYTLYGVDGLNLSVKSDDLKLVYNEKEYTPNKGSISFTIRSTDATAPVPMSFTNTGSEKTTYKITLTSPEGSAANPIAMKDGSVTVKLEENNSRGVYYQYKAPYEGTFTLECKNTVNYTVTIKNLNDNESVTLDKNTKKATIDVRKNDKIQIVVTAVAKDGKYPATEAKLAISSKKLEIPVTPPTTGGNDGDNNKPTLNTNGKLINADAPIEYGGSLAISFDAEVKAGEIVLFHLYKVNGMIVRISDATAYIIYLDKTYTPDSNGYVYVPVTSDSPNTPIAIQIGNGGKENKTYAVKLSFPEGSMMNPYDAKAGTIKTQLAANNDQGVYYSCTAEKDGKMTITLKSITSGVKCDIQVTAYDSSYIPRQHSLLASSEDGKTFTLDIYADDEITILVVAQPDEDFKYPAATVEFTVSFS